MRGEPAVGDSAEGSPLILKFPPGVCAKNACFNLVSRLALYYRLQVGWVYRVMLSFTSVIRGGLPQTLQVLLGEW